MSDAAVQSGHPKEQAAALWLFPQTARDSDTSLCHGLLAAVCSLASQVGEALANVASGFAFQSKNGETWSTPELHRIHGDVLLHSGNASQSQVSYRRAIESARQAGARGLELRAVARLRELPTLQSAGQKARRTLIPLPLERFQNASHGNVHIEPPLAGRLHCCKMMLYYEMALPNFETPGLNSRCAS